MPLTLKKQTVNLVIDQGCTFEKVITAQNSAGSNVTISLTSTQTTSIPDGNYVYDVEYTQSGGDIERVVEGIITVSPEATK